jgi:hypothetical protein
MLVFFRWIVAAVLCLQCGAVLAWSDHASLLWPLVRTMPDLLQPTVTVESLDAFLQAEAQGLEQLLADEEVHARQTIIPYAPRPDSLVFRADARDLRRAFFEAVRINPTLFYAPYRQATVEDVAEYDVTILRYADLSFLTPDVTNKDTVYFQLSPGDRVAPAHIIASASDEPDFGMDIGLFTNYGSEFGARYGFAEQPFGNPNLEYSSQAPFHMGFYHLDWLTRTAQPALLNTYPEWRIQLFGALAAYAFSTGHDYWGWRFTGWALHYIGDLSQPYHAQPLPGVSTASALWLLVWGETDQAIQLVSNRHGVLESYQYQRVQDALNRRAWDDPILLSIASGGPATEYADRTLRDGLSLESAEAGTAIDAALETYMPARFVSNPSFEWTGSGEEPGVVDTVRNEGGAQAVDALDLAVAAQLRRFSRYARAWIDRAVLAAYG